MIWQAENPMPQYTVRLKSKLLLQIMTAGLIGNWKYTRRLVLEFALRGQLHLLAVISVALALVDNMRGKVADSFGGLE